MIAEMLGWPQATFASKVEIAGEKCTVVREVDGGLETIAFALPAVITHRPAAQRTALRVAARNHEGAQKSRLRKLPADSLGVDLAPKLKIKTLNAPRKRKLAAKSLRSRNWSGAAHGSEGI